MKWSTPKDLKAVLCRLWERGELLRDVFSDQPRFPLRLPIKGPSSVDIADRFQLVCNWVVEWTQPRFLRVEWQQVHHRVQGTQTLPVAAWVDSLDDALRWLAVVGEWQRFMDVVHVTQASCPSLLPWLQRRPLQALLLAAEWPRLLAVVAWMLKHPRPAVYWRQVDVPGVHSKFIEMHRSVLAELFDLALPPDSVDSRQMGVAHFAARYGFLEKPARIRFRLLDAQTVALPGVSCPDMTLDAHSFSGLRLDVQWVFITENETNFLAFPHVPKAMVIFGAGYGWDALGQARWLERCHVHYWGDIDTHGFAILAQLRGHFPHVASLLMDRNTFERHAAFWGREEKPEVAELSGLTPDESALYDDLRHNHMGEKLRLEQEHLGFDWVHEHISACVALG